MAAELGDPIADHHLHLAAPRPITGTLVIEAVLESLEVKADVFRAAAEHFGAECILATNTSSLSITEIAARSPLPERVVGMHFFNPVPVMKLVEVVTRAADRPGGRRRDRASSPRRWGKDVARVKSAPGFIVNRVARGFYGEALRLSRSRWPQPHTIDEIMRGAGGFRMGPFELMDLIGNDVNAAVTRSVWTAFHFDPRFEPSRIQDELVAAGTLRPQERATASTPTPREPPLRGRRSPCHQPRRPARMIGSCPQLEALLERSGVRIEPSSGAGTAAARTGPPGAPARRPPATLAVMPSCRRDGRPGHPRSDRQDRIGGRDGAPVLSSTAA